MVMQSSGARSMAGSPAAATQPGPAADQTPESGPPRFGPTLKAVALSVVALVVLLGLGLILRRSTATHKESRVSISATAAANTLRLKGTTEAIKSRAILAPVLSGQQVGSLTITKILPAGTHVKRGDLLVEFDRQAQVRDFLDKQAEYNKLVGQVSEQQAKEDTARAKDETELHQAGSDLKSAELEIKKVELMSRIDVEKAQLNLEQAKATLEQLKKTFDLKRSAARAAIRILEIQRDRTRRIMQNAQTNAELMQIRAPLDGVVVLNKLGALSPLDIYRSESQVASRRVQVIQSEYVLKQAEDAIRFTLGAEVDPFLRALDLELTELPARDAQLLDIDAAAALKQALDARPELEAQRQSLANDDTSIRLAHNNLLPDLRLGASYAGNGLAGSPSGGLGDSLNQAFGFGYPTYGFSLNLNLPIRNRAAQADLGNALVSRRRDLYAERQLREQITLEVTNAIHSLEQAKLSLAASNEALDVSKKNLNAVQRKHELGSETVFFVLEAQTELAQAESSVLQAEVAYQLAVAAVQHATGKLLEPYQVQISDLIR